MKKLTLNSIRNDIFLFGTTSIAGLTNKEESFKNFAVRKLDALINKLQLQADKDKKKMGGDLAYMMDVRKIIGE